MCECALGPLIDEIWGEDQWWHLTAQGALALQHCQQAALKDVVQHFTAFPVCILILLLFPSPIQLEFKLPTETSVASP